MIGAAIEHHWLTPGRRYGHTMHAAECLLNIKNSRDAWLKLYPVIKPFSPPALGIAGFQRSDWRHLNAAAAGRVAELDAAPYVGFDHAEAAFFRPEIWSAIAPYLYVHENALAVGRTR
jgi:hypothetical protein